MIDRLVRFSLAQPLFVLLLTALFIAGGLAAFRSLPVEAYPDVGDIQATVITLYPGHAPEEVEKQVTIPIEIGLSGIPHGVRIFSHTQFGLSYVIVTFDDAIDDYFARQQVLERLQGIDGLPAGIQPNLDPLSTAIGEIYRYRLDGGGLDATELRSLQDWVVSRRLKQCPGVADVVTLGGLIKQYRVEVDPARMEAHAVTLQSVQAALGRGSANAGGSIIDQGSQQLIVRGVGLLRSVDEIGDIVVDARGGSPILIKDVATVSVGSVPRQGVVGQDNDDEAVTGIVLMRKGENPSDVLQTLKERINALNNSSELPKGVSVRPFYDRSQLVGTTLHTVFKNLCEGAALVSIVLLIFLRSGRAAGIVATIIPLALLGTFIGLRLRGISANLLSLGAMDFGIIVDGAVIVIENIVRRLGEEQPKTLGEKRSVIAEAAIQVGRPTFFSMLIIIIAHVPIFALQRHEGRIFAPMAYTIISALLGSLLFSLTLVPLLAQLGLRSVPERLAGWMQWCQRTYRSVLSGALRWRRTILVGSAGALALSLLLAMRLGTEFLPELNEGTLWLNINLPVSVSLPETKAMCRRLRQAVQAVPEVGTVVSKAGRPEDGTDPKMINMTEFFVDIKPEREWRSGMTRQRIYDEIRDHLDAFPGLDVSFSQPIRDNVLESISQIDGQIVIKIFGDDMSQIEALSSKVLATVAPIRGVASASIDRDGEVPQLVIAIDRARAARYGLNVGDIEDVIEAGLGGKAVSELWEGDRRFDIAVRFPDTERQDTGTIRRLMIDTPSGARVPLENVADVHIGSGKVNISHEDGRRMEAISIFIRNRDMGSLVEEMRRSVDTAVHLPPGYAITYGGEFENQQRAMKRLALIVPVSVFMIFILLFNAFGSLTQALMILANVPLALIGGVLALSVTGIPLSVSAAIGFIALMGQAVLNGVVLVSTFNELRARSLSPALVALRGAALRLRTVLMTALLAMLGLLPMALSHEIGSEVQRPLAVVVIGGLISATLLTLIVVPILYYMLDRRRTAPASEGER
jgi:cobalt-zinc-cadmium resistance protein CzcA